MPEDDVFNGQGAVDGLLGVGTFAVGAGVVHNVADQSLNRSQPRDVGDGRRHKVSKRVANYVAQTRVVDEFCGNCAHYNDDDSCDLVAGRISHNGHSNLWEAG